MPIKLVAAPIVAFSTQVLINSAKPLTDAMVQAVVNIKDLYKQPLKVTIPTLLATSYGLSSGASLGYALAQGAIYGFNAYHISNSKNLKEFFVNTGAAAGGIYGLNVGPSWAAKEIPWAGLPALKESVHCITSVIIAALSEYGFRQSSSAVFDILKQPFKE